MSCFCTSSLKCVSVSGHRADHQLATIKIMSAETQGQGTPPLSGKKFSKIISRLQADVYHFVSFRKSASCVLSLDLKGVKIVEWSFNVRCCNGRSRAYNEVTVDLSDTNRGGLEDVQAGRSLFIPELLQRNV